MNAERIGSQGIGNFDGAPRKEAEAFSNVAFLFPGQGSQTPGMGKDLYYMFRSAKDTFDEADEVLERNLSRICFEGPAGVLRATDNAQPAILTVSIATYRAWKEINGDRLPKPSFVAGHSLGEYTALVLAKSLSFPDALRLVQERSRLMREAGELKSGGMAAILGVKKLTDMAVEEICQQTGVQIANFNSPDQIVISGPKENIPRALDLFKSAGVKSIELQVSGAFHSNLMRYAVTQLAEAIDKKQFEKPEVPIISNVTAELLREPEAIKMELKQQIIKPVQWQKSIEAMRKFGVGTVLEIGPGKVLTGLAERIDNQLRTFNISNVLDIQSLALNPSV